MFLKTLFIIKLLAQMNIFKLILSLEIPDLPLIKNNSDLPVDTSYIKLP